MKAAAYFPADLVLLWSTSPLETAIEMAWYDGDKSLRLRQVNALPSSCPVVSLGTGLQGDQNPITVCQRSGSFAVTKPNADMDKIVVHFIPAAQGQVCRHVM